MTTCCQVTRGRSRFLLSSGTQCSTCFAVICHHSSSTRAPAISTNVLGLTAPTSPCQFAPVRVIRCKCCLGVVSVKLLTRYAAVVDLNVENHDVAVFPFRNHHDSDGLPFHVNRFVEFQIKSAHLLQCPKKQKTKNKSSLRN